MAGEGEPLLGRSGGPGFQPTKHDPLMKMGMKRVENALVKAGLADEGEKHHVVMRATALTVVPVAIFNLLLFTIWRFYHTRPVISLFFCLQVALLGALVPQMSKKGESSWHEKWKNYLSQFCFAAAVLGMTAGLFVHYRHLIYYQRYKEMKVYSNVAASSSPMLVADAGIVSFSSDSLLDAGQAIGYRSAEMGATLCVAPVIDTSMSSTDPISFFAGGVDCCGWRGQFTCGDAMDPKAISGLLYIPPAQLVVPAMEWAVKDDELMEEFHRAVKLHAAVYSSRAGENVRFLHWAKDPREMRDSYRVAAVWACLGYDALFSCLCAFAAAIVALGPQRLEQFVEKMLSSVVHRASKNPRGGAYKPPLGVGR
mmetsp:Transcript_30914/g.88964  ORF Transcript_30914/g.88964 Transcript_30914/m.88964 type:complete len:368 (-) Transcript_30914:43-1146(-)